MRSVLLILFISIAYARINPFESVITPQNSIIVKPKYFTGKKIYLPNDARILKKIIFVYQSLNGDEKQKSVNINKNIDFHSPIIVTHKPKQFSLDEYDFANFKLFIKNKKFFIQTKDKLIRTFFLAEPFRLVLDFKKNVYFLTIQKIIKNSFIKKVAVGAHSGFYRIVIYFDAKYFYKIIKKDEGLLIELK